MTTKELRVRKKFIFILIIPVIIGVVATLFIMLQTATFGIELPFGWRTTIRDSDHRSNQLQEYCNDRLSPGVACEQKICPVRDYQLFTEDDDGFPFKTIRIVDDEQATMDARCSEKIEKNTAAQTLNISTATGAIFVVIAGLHLKVFEYE